MYEDAQKIFGYLPIRRDTPENDYINHLWQSFSSLDEGEAVARPFAVMPFHLLFMLAIQYKVLRIYKEQKEKYELALITKNPRDEEKDILAPESPLAIAFLGESEIVDFLKIVGLSANDARSIKKSIIRYRNDKIAHAKGYIEKDIETKITEYFSWLEKIQLVFLEMNKQIVNKWLTEIQGTDDMGVFLEMNIYLYHLTFYDLGYMMSLLFESGKLNSEQKIQFEDKILEIALIYN